MNSRQKTAVSGAVFGLGFLLAGVLLTPDPLLLYNPSESADPGWYRVCPGAPFAPGDLVAASLPERAGELARARGYLPAGVPVIKQVGAIGGDEVCWSGQEATLPGGSRLELLGQDRAGRPMPAPPPGCVTLAPDQVFLRSDRSEASFDSRYFGPVEASDVIGPVRFLGPGWGAAISALVAGRDEGCGAGYCKIKARSAETGTELCLHIDSYSAYAVSSALRRDPHALELQVFLQRSFTSDPCTSVDTG